LGTATAGAAGVAGDGDGFEGIANRSGKRLPARRATPAATVSHSSISSSLKRRNLGRGGDGGGFVTSGSPPRVSVLVDSPNR
jgi:hypothetical protein